MVYNFDSNIAKEYGVNEAIMIANFQFWIKKNKANKKNFFDGHYWTYNSKKAFMELFDFWSEQSIKTILNHLKEKGVLITANYNNSPYDRTLWYAFADEEKWIGEKEIFQKLDLTNGKIKTNQPIPDILPNKKPYDIYIPKTEKTGYGEFQNVMLTKDEVKKLITKYGLLFQDAVELLSNYIASVGKDKYKNHYAVMKENGWVWEKVHKTPNADMKKLQLVSDGNGGYREETIEEYYKRTMNLDLD
ncbi:MAG: hypothetical protein UHM08_09255 [Bacteroidales bacterium]|nr:hypothetical protein [Bacteroidales bacterium]